MFPPGTDMPPGDLDDAIDALTNTGRVKRRLARLDNYLRKLAAGDTFDEAFFGVGILLDVPGHPWPALCEVDATNRPVRLKPALLDLVRDCVEAFRASRPGRRKAGTGSAPATRAERFHKLAATLGHVGRADAESVRRMVRAGKVALRDPK